MLNTYRLTWSSKISVNDAFNIIVVGSADNALKIGESLKTCLDQLFENEKSQVHCSENFNFPESIKLEADYIIILFSNAEDAVKRNLDNEIKTIDPRFLLMSRIIAVNLLKYGEILRKNNTSAVNFSKKYDCLLLVGCTEEAKYLNDLSDEILQYCLITTKNKYDIFSNRRL